MKLKTTLLGYGAISVAIAVIIGGIGFWSNSQLETTTGNILSSTEDLQNISRIESEHDAIRADALGLILAYDTNNAKRMQEGLDDLAKHSKALLEASALLIKNTESDAIRADAKTMAPQLEQFVADAKKIAQLASGGAMDDGADMLNDATSMLSNEPTGKKSAPIANVKASGKAQTMSLLNAEYERLDHTFDMLNEALDKDVAVNEAEANADEADAVRIASSTKTTVIVLGFIAVALLLGMALWITRRILNTIGGEPAEALSVANAISLGDFTNQINIQNNDNTSILASMKKMQANLSTLITGIKEAADSIATGSQEISAGNTNLSQRTEEQASSLEETASSMEQMASTVKQNAENAKQANTLASDASTVAVKGGEVVGQVVDTMSEINTSSKKIVDIISVIDGIAFQTNILALNAAVEAARAGEQGRGFAVVAAEVRSLAQRSATAAKEIKQLIGDSVEKVQGGTLLVTEAGKTMDEIVTSVRKVTDIVNEIAAASQQQSAGIDQVNNAITNMDEVTQQNAALVEQAAAAAEALESQAHEMMQSVSQFKLANGDGQGMLGQQKGNGDARAHLNEMRAERTSELPSAKPNGRSRLKAPKAKKEEEWEEF
jgi:methyl-accepting chemotaxis protein